MHDHDDLPGRLDHLGTAPVPADVRDRHLSAMRAATPAGGPARRRFGRVAVAAAAIAGFAVGSTGFAMAGALPAPAQGVAHDVLAVVQVEVPDRGNGNGACMSAAATLDGEAKRSAKEACKAAKATGRPEGAPGRAGDPPGQQGKPATHPNHDGDPCTGKPPWAGKQPKADKDALRAQHGACRPEDADEAEAPPVEEPPVEAPDGGL